MFEQAHLVPLLNIQTKSSLPPLPETRRQKGGLSGWECDSSEDGPVLLRGRDCVLEREREREGDMVGLKILLTKSQHCNELKALSCTYYLANVKS